MEMARNMSTGMEFGGWNGGDNLNPSQQDQMNKWFMFPKQEANIIQIQIVAI